MTTESLGISGTWLFGKLAFTVDDQAQTQGITELRRPLFEACARLPSKAIGWIRAPLVVRPPIPTLPRVRFRRLQIQANPLAINQNCSGVNQLLACAIVAFIAPQRFQRQEEFHPLRTIADSGLAACRHRNCPNSSVNRCAEGDSVNGCVALKLERDRPYQMSDVIVKCQCRQFVARTSHRCRKL